MGYLEDGGPPRDYFYDPPALGDDEEPPVFASTPQVLTVLQGQSLVVPCDVHNIGEQRGCYEGAWVINETFTVFEKMRPML